ncbi:MAG: hypothetical protein CM15mP111_1010 [Hyphomicrobiales bacterium]|nr:MAG: hypothetical protein CM15mP111_1010 [Hyphomicrobiales bacterium]
MLLFSGYYFGVIDWCVNVVFSSSWKHLSIKGVSKVLNKRIFFRIIIVI